MQRNLKLLTLHCSLIDVDRGMFCPLLPEVNNHLLCFADIEGETVVLSQCKASCSIYKTRK